ncbi:hypothetical protein [Legionella shakespearei]|uniref:Uncharacterized protein n=1 Tax=Legionella shakespearei DSM 23087 TaxID=1122169 RepID=A0A0W0YVR9_9GAMM|nr:hypothetical protein [Legionella shakespearei]KTD60916.1 hypothetical protein Lsha_1327 [Legionella shakespearei DSM 23087]
MKIHFVLIALLLISMPYVLNKDLTQTSSVVADTVQHTEQCPQKSVQKSLTSACKSGTSCFNLMVFTVDYDLQSRLSQILFFIYPSALSKGFRLPIYKPPQIFN